MKYLLIALFVASATALVRRDATVAQPNDFGLGAVQKGIEDAFKKLDVAELQNVLKSAGEKTAAIFQDTAANIKTQLEAAAPEAKAKFEEAKKKFEEAGASMQKAITENNPQLMKQAESTLNGIQAQFGPQVEDFKAKITQLGEEIKKIVSN